MVIDNFVHHDTFQARRHDLLGPSFTLVTEEKRKEVETYSQDNPNMPVRKAHKNKFLNKLLRSCKEKGTR